MIEQVRNLYKTSIIQNALRTDNPPQLHGLVYDISGGLLKDLNWQEAEFKRYEHIYGIIGQTQADVKDPEKLEDITSH